MNQIKFGNYKSYDDLYLICTKKTIGSPSAKTTTVDIAGGDGVIDYTEYFGDVKFNNRQLYFEFETIVPQAQFPELYSRILNALNGKKVHIVLDEDDDFYYVGRLSISDFTNYRGIGSISIDCDCEPYKFKKNATVVNQDVYGTALITLENLRKRAVPTIRTYTTMTFEFAGYSVTHGSGTFIIPELELVEGDNQITVTVPDANRIPFPYADGSSKVSYGVTWTVDSDGSITANGTITNSTYTNYFLNRDSFTLPKGTYMLTGLPDPEGVTSAGRIVIDRNGTNIIIMNMKGGSGSFTLEENTTIDNIYIRWYTEGTTFDNVIFNPKLYMARKITFSYQEGGL